MSRATKLFRGATAEYIAFADGFFEKADLVTYTELEFWNLIGTCRSKLDSIPVDPYVSHEYEVFGEAIRKLSTEQLYYADQHFYKTFLSLYRKEIWSAVSFVQGYCSSDGFVDFMQWTMTCGQLACVKIIADADNLPELISRYERNTIELEGVISYSITGEFESRTGFEIPRPDLNWELHGAWIEEEDIVWRLPNCHRFKEIRAQGQR